MATWKKVVVSGSNISQLNNDAGYLTSVTAQNTFATMSINGINVIADSAVDTLTFASSSGAGLNITGDAGTDTITFAIGGIPNSSLTNSSITIAGNATSLGGSITAATILGGTGVFSGSAQITGLTNANLSGTAGITNANLANSAITIAGNATALGGSVTQAQILAGSTVVSASVLSSPSQGTALLTTNGVAGSTIDLGLETSDSPSFVGLTLTGNLVVLGTASFQNTNNLLVADRFVLFASGSNTTGDGGIVVQQGTQNIGELYGYDSGTTRWGFTSSFDATGNSFTPAVYAGGVEASLTTPSAAPLYGGASNGFGTIHVNTATGDIYIYA